MYSKDEEDRTWEDDSTFLNSDTILEYPGDWSLDNWSLTDPEPRQNESSSHANCPSEGPQTDSNQNSLFAETQILQTAQPVQRVTSLNFDPSGVSGVSQPTGTTPISTNNSNTFFQNSSSMLLASPPPVQQTNYFLPNQINRIPTPIIPPYAYPLTTAAVSYLPVQQTNYFIQNQRMPIPLNPPYTYPPTTASYPSRVASFTLSSGSAPISEAVKATTAYGKEQLLEALRSIDNKDLTSIDKFFQNSMNDILQLEEGKFKECIVEVITDSRYSQNVGITNLILEKIKKLLIIRKLIDDDVIFRLSLEKILPKLSQDELAKICTLTKSKKGLEQKRLAIDIGGPLFVLSSLGSLLKQKLGLSIGMDKRHPKLAYTLGCTNTNLFKKNHIVYLPKISRSNHQIESIPIEVSDENSMLEFNSAWLNQDPDLIRKATQKLTGFLLNFGEKERSNFLVKLVMNISQPSGFIWIEGQELDELLHGLKQLINAEVIDKCLRKLMPNFAKKNLEDIRCVANPIVNLLSSSGESFYFLYKLSKDFHLEGGPLQKMVGIVHVSKRRDCGLNHRMILDSPSFLKKYEEYLKDKDDNSITSVVSGNSAEGSDIFTEDEWEELTHNFKSTSESLIKKFNAAWGAKNVSAIKSICQEIKDFLLKFKKDISDNLYVEMIVNVKYNPTRKYEKKIKKANESLSGLISIFNQKVFENCLIRIIPKLTKYLKEIRESTLTTVELIIDNDLGESLNILNILSRTDKETPLKDKVGIINLFACSSLDNGKNIYNYHALVDKTIFLEYYEKNCSSNSGLLQEEVPSLGLSPYVPGLLSPNESPQVQIGNWLENLGPNDGDYSVADDNLGPLFLTPIPAQNMSNSRLEASERDTAQEKSTSNTSVQNSSSMLLALPPPVQQTNYFLPNQINRIPTPIIPPYAYPPTTGVSYPFPVASYTHFLGGRSWDDILALEEAKFKDFIVEVITDSRYSQNVGITNMVIDKIKNLLSTRKLTNDEVIFRPSLEKILPKLSQYELAELCTLTKSQEKRLANNISGPLYILSMLFEVRPREDLSS